MNTVIKNILEKRTSNEEKVKELQVLLEEIDIAQKILSGVYTYCPNCDDYYLSKSFFSETETKDAKICVFTDPINSSGDVYKDGRITSTFRVCPKGHRFLIKEQESDK